MKKVRYPAQFKAEAVKQVTECDHGVVDVAKRLGMSGKSPFLEGRVANGQPGVDSAENAILKADISRFKSELKRANEERVILTNTILSSTGRCNTNLIECCYRRNSIWRKKVGRDFPQSIKKDL